ncbi:Gfo/Idh/MocA family protein [Roseateles saccharophilus]|uniref:Putative dehydrogenase n=1 Tax=Roseateles saccharophilus TaxID=304 RepID=A0A4R3V790_ROSSA|nr:Gfo/Idh/MocA family oxidoreductase [Roseateles saccharophilus]MDG0831610.1 Gfo/Idh/MocA family oxidoreductase [Roseateles saccharophilus]TCV00977.1 putative dehydrogenase [Roseateles saccharophilus]
MAPDHDIFRWGVIGPGGIANRFAGALAAVPGARLAAVFARDVAKGLAYARQWQQAGEPARVTTDLAELLASAEVDAVYIATPHSNHGEYVRAALLAGKPVLCEKPLVTSLEEGQALVDLARERGVFLMEALWTRFLPAYELAGRWLREGAIGELRAMQSSFCFSAPYDPQHRAFNPALAGGALWDIGIYNLAVTRWVLQQMNDGACPEPTAIDVSAQLAPTGVDAAVVVTLHFPGGVSSQFRCGFDAHSMNAFEALGSKAALRFPTDFWQAEAAELVTRKAPTRCEAAPFVVNGFEGEIAEAQACIRAGLPESPRMPHAETLALLGWMDAIRARFSGGVNRKG